MKFFESKKMTIAGQEQRNAHVSIAGWLASGLFMGLVILTGWNLSRTDALAEAVRSYPPSDREDIGALRLSLRRAMDHLAYRPRDPRAALLAARCLSRLHYDALADPYFEMADKSEPLGLNDLRARAECLTNARQLEKAISVEEAILRLDPNDALALRRLGATRFGQKRYDEALSLAKRLKKIPGSEETGWLMLGSIYQEKLLAKQAADAYQQVLRLDPDLTGLGGLPTDLFWSDYTDSMLMAGEGRAAIARKTLERAIELQESAVLWDLIGRSYQEESAENSTREAERCYRQALRIDPRLASAWKHLGILRSIEHPRESLEMLERAESLSPKDVQTLHQLGLIHNRLGQTGRAKLYMRRAAAIRAEQKPKGGMGEAP